MPNTVITNITAGELSPTLLGRPDIERYGNGCIRLENFLLTPTGMWSFRPGWRFMGSPKTTDSAVKLRRFEPSDDLPGYIVELGHLYFRVWVTGEDGGALRLPNTQMPLEGSTPFPAEELYLLSFSQSADFLFITHEHRGVFAIKRRGPTDWICESFPLQDGPYGRENADLGKTMAFSAVGGSPTVSVDGFPAGEPFAAGDEGRPIRVKDGEHWRWLKIEAVNAPHQVVASLQPSNVPDVGDLTFPIGEGQWDFRLGLYSARLGWPTCCSVHEQRLLLGGPRQVPDRIDGSRIAAFEDFGPGVDPDDAWGYALGTKGANRIMHFATGNELLAFTLGTEHRVAGDSSGATITPLNIWTRPVGRDGSRRIEPVEIGNAILHIDKLGLSLRALSWNVQFQGYTSENLNLLADHMPWLGLGSRGFNALAWQSEPFGIVWTIRGNAEVAGVTYNPGERVLGWHRHPMGNPEGAWIVVESIETVKGPTWHEVWAVVRRTFPEDGRVLRTIERMDRAGLWEAPPESLLHLDSGLSLRNTPAGVLGASATTGANVDFQIKAGTFVWPENDTVGRFIKHRWLKGYDRHGRQIVATAIAKITERVSATLARGDILSPFPEYAVTLGLHLEPGTWGLSVTRVTGLDHLNGLDVTAVSDGRVCPPKTVENGAIDLDVPGWEIHAGLPYTGRVVTLPLDPGPQPAVGQGRLVRIDRILARVLNSIGGEFQAVPATEEEKDRFQKLIPYKQGTAAPQAPPPAFSGDKVLYTAGAWTRRAELEIRHDQPVPLNVSLMVVHTYAPFVQP